MAPPFVFLLPIPFQSYFCLGLFNISPLNSVHPFVKFRFALGPQVSFGFRPLLPLLLLFVADVHRFDSFTHKLTFRRTVSTCGLGRDEVEKSVLVTGSEVESVDYRLHLARRDVLLFVLFAQFVVLLEKLK